jgi:hypothetical protein
LTCIEEYNKRVSLADGRMKERCEVQVGYMRIGLYKWPGITQQSQISKRKFKSPTQISRPVTQTTQISSYVLSRRYVRCQLGTFPQHASLIFNIYHTMYLVLVSYSYNGCFKFQLEVLIGGTTEFLVAGVNVLLDIVRWSSDSFHSYVSVPIFNSLDSRATTSSDSDDSSPFLESAHILKGLPCAQTSQSGSSGFVFAPPLSQMNYDSLSGVFLCRPAISTISTHQTSHDGSFLG